MSTPSLSPGVGEAQASPVEKFRKKPIEIAALQWTEDMPLSAAAAFLGDDFRGSTVRAEGLCLLINTLENPDNPFVAPPGWWLIRGIKGEHYACAPDVFAASYDPAPEPLELTPEEQAAKEKSEHMSTCHEEACVDCMKELRAIRRIVKAIRPVIEEEATKPLKTRIEALEKDLAEEERSVLAVIDERDRYGEVADDLAHAIAVTVGADIGEHSSMNDPWQNALEALGKPDVAAVAAALDQSSVEEPEGEKQ